MDDRSEDVRRRASRRGRVGLMDVAAHAGVSHITVSRVIHRATNVRPLTRERVLTAMRELGYQPNSAARALVTGRSRTIGVISFNTALYGPAAAMQGLEQAAAHAGYFVAVSGLEALDAAALRQAVDRFHQQSVAGIIVISPQRALAQGLSEMHRDVPVVTLWGQPDSAVPLVASGEIEGARQATRHLLDLGHATVGHLSGPAGRYGAEARIEGWREALLAAGLEPPAWRVGDWSARSGYEQGCEILRDPSVTALFVASDQMALGVLRAAAEAGRRVPADLSIVGFDDIPEAAYYMPPLTTVRQDFRGLGRSAVELLLPLINGTEPAVSSTIREAELIIRASTASAR